MGPCVNPEQEQAKLAEIVEWTEHEPLRALGEELLKQLEEGQRVN